MNSDYNDIMFNQLILSPNPEIELQNKAESFEGNPSQAEFVTLKRRLKQWRKENPLRVQK